MTVSEWLNVNIVENMRSLNFCAASHVHFESLVYSVHFADVEQILVLEMHLTHCYCQKVLICTVLPLKVCMFRFVSSSHVILADDYGDTH